MEGGVMMARLNITIPDDLKQRMDKLARKPNWSAIAAAAFESFVAAHNSPSDIKPEPNFQTVAFCIVGTAPYVQNVFRRSPYEVYPS